jgi:hypothetical protein
MEHVTDKPRRCICASARGLLLPIPFIFILASLRVLAPRFIKLSIKSQKAIGMREFTFDNFDLPAHPSSHRQVTRALNRRVNVAYILGPAPIPFKLIAVASTSFALQIFKRPNETYIRAPRFVPFRKDSPSPDLGDILSKKVAFKLRLEAQ